MAGKKLKIGIAFFDVDGVLTDGTKSYYQDGSVSKVFHDQDSYGLKELKRTGVEVYFKNTNWLFLEKITRQVISLFVVVL